MKVKKLMIGPADDGLRQLRKDVGTGYRWAKRKFQMRKIRKMKLAETERELKFKV